MWREEPTLELPNPEGLTLWKGPTLGQCMKSSLEKEDFSRGRNPTLEQGRSVRHPPLGEKRAAETAAPIPHLAVGKEAEGARSNSEPGTISRAEGRLWDICLRLLTAPRQVSFEEESQNPPAVGHWKPLMPSKGDKEEPESGCQDAGGVHEPQSTEQLNVSRLRSSSVEIREKGSEFLRDELHKAQKELKLKDKECERLSKVREQLEQELEELTASLFEEAHKMVREANTKQAAAEKQLREARGKIDMLQAEVTALKTLVITSTPSSPNRELHPQLQSPSKAGFRKGHGRNKSTSSAVVSAASQNVAPEPISRECRESGFPALLSLLLCILPGKAIHITYEPGWQALGADASSFSSSSRQLLLVPGEQTPWHRGDVLESGLFQLCSLMFFVLLSLGCFFFLLFFFLSEAFVGLVGAALSVRLVLCPVFHLGFKCQIPQNLLLPLIIPARVEHALCLFSACVVAFLQPQEGGKTTWRKMG
ncbi:guanine nucleotide exchange factor for Rab-3A isoform X5 [Anomalospiza imberbis]|uniref:guanine nucleotide exchange factor for Rab-3A isoform X5 n=1 Tax=Anomalospiza imberbis TaxID=187417 RepID=UPI00358F140D